VEAAIALTAVVIVLALCLGAVLAASIDLRCIDAAREAARLTARGDEVKAAAVARKLLPSGAQIAARNDGDYVVVTVTAAEPLFPLLSIRAEAVAAMEPADGR